MSAHTNRTDHGHAPGHGHHGHTHGAHHASGVGADESEKPYTDPVCGMKVAASEDKKHVFESRAYYFCSARCLDKFRASPQTYLQPPAPAETAEAQAGTIYSCPMHPEIRQSTPGNCPICGMALEPLI
ncbi:MAG TPA: heavy metal-binding domain-containing protein, partial [Burkholderiales bacterium]